MSNDHLSNRLSPLALELLNTTDEQFATFDEGAKEGLIELAPVVLPEQPIGDNNHLGFAEATKSGDTLVVIHRRMTGHNPWGAGNADEHSSFTMVTTSDNGGAGYIGLPDINQPYRGWKLTHFEGGTHVPFMAKWPARIKAGTIMNDPVHHVDLFHTFAAAAGGTVPDNVTYDGVDLTPFVRNETAGKPHETLFWRQGHHQSVLHKSWKLIRADTPDKRWLFNLAIDPTEQNNLADSEPEHLAELEALLTAHNAQQADPLWPSFLDSPQLIDKHGGQAYKDGDEYIYWPN